MPPVFSRHYGSREAVCKGCHQKFHYRCTKARKQRMDAFMQACLRIGMRLDLPGTARKARQITEADAGVPVNCTACSVCTIVKRGVRVKVGVPVAAVIAPPAAPPQADVLTLHLDDGLPLEIDDGAKPDLFIEATTDIPFDDGVDNAALADLFAETMDDDLPPFAAPAM